jgi:hypothetical protein
MQALCRASPTSGNTERRMETSSEAPCDKQRHFASFPCETTWREARQGSDLPPNRGFRPENHAVRQAPDPAAPCR